MAWPLPALLAWAGCWLAWFALRAAGVSFGPACALACLLGIALAWRVSTPWRRACVAGGFPLSFGAVVVAGSVPAWAWLLPLALLLGLYPLKAWRDAPLFPTPDGALRGLADAVRLQAGDRILEAGCGLGAGLVELRREYPQARLSGVEWSWPLKLACAWRCRDADVSRADLWQVPWSDYRLVYLFQRPESLARALTKAAAEMAPGSWLASLEFEAAGVAAQAVLRADGAKPVWLYQLPADTP